MPRDFININGSFYLGNEACLQTNNRGFKYGDGFFETIASFGDNIFFLSSHIKRIKMAAQTLQMELPIGFSTSFLENQIQLLLHKNNLFKNNRIRISFYREGEGLYTPENNSMAYVMEAKENPKGLYEFNKKGILVDLYNNLRKPANSLGSFKPLSAQLYVLAALDKQRQKKDDLLLLNEKGEIIEAISSNIFLCRKDKTIVTPPLTSGCVDGIMRRQVIDLIPKLIMAVEEKPITPDMLQNAEEIFLTNAISGIQWVLGYKDKRYYNNVSKQLSGLLIKSVGY